MSNDFQSIFSPYLKDYLAERKANGYKYDNHRHCLSKFDAYCWERNVDKAEITQELIDGFCYGEEYLDSSTIHLKEVSLLNFLNYLNGIGIPVVPFKVKYSPRKNSGFTPHIFTNDELRWLFAAIDNQPPAKNSSAHLTDPVLFRLLLGSGLRISEALGLQIRDFNYEQKYIVLLETKNQKQRLVPIADSVAERIQSLILGTCDSSNPDEHIFKPAGRNHYRVASINRHFQEYLRQAGIPHTDNGPRIHDLRHTFCVKCFHRWITNGKDLENLVPYLSAYLGHTDFSGTEVYLRLTAEMYPELIEQTSHVMERLCQKGWWDYE